MKERKKLTDKKSEHDKRLVTFSNRISLALMILAFVSIFASLPIVSAQGSYVRSVPAYTYGSQTSSLLGNQLYAPFDPSMCQGRQDFILQVDPLGCTPSVVRSDLLEQQPVAVFCPIVATQLNPLISINAINSMTIVPNNLPKDVQTIGYQPAQAALGQYNPSLTTPYLGNIGYATIVLRQQPNESAMPNFVQGNLTARINYNIQNAFGVGQAVYYLPQLTDDEFNNGINAYSFWDGKGYLRLDGSDNTGATISVYSGASNAASPSTAKAKIATLNLNNGQTSSDVYLPGFNFCMGGLKVQLQGLENPDTTAKIMVDSDVIEAREGETFLDGRCTVNSVTKYGVVQNVKISCNEDQQRSSFLLGINPKVTLTIGATTKDYSVGDYLFDYSDSMGQYSVYLGFVGNSGKVGALQNLYIRTIMIPKTIRSGGNLSNDEISYVAGYDKSLVGGDVSTGSVTGTIADGGKTVLATITQQIRAFLTGKRLDYLKYSGSSTSFLGQNVNIVGYAGAYDTDISKLPSAIQSEYQSAMSDYNTIVQNYATESAVSGSATGFTYGQQALEKEINLANNFNQKRTALQLCQQYIQDYQATPPHLCNDLAALSSTDNSQQSVLINGATHTISLAGVTEPSFDEYGVQISVKYPDGTYQTENLSKNGVVYLSQSTGEYIQLTDLSIGSATFTTSLLASSQTTLGKIGIGATKQPTQILRLGTQDTFGSKYSFAIQKINLQKVAKVSVVPDINYAQSNATFNFKIGIEKRGIQLTPNQTLQRIQSLNSTIKKWSDIQSTLNTVVTAGKTACLITEGVLLVKNFIANLGGAGAARQAVMRNTGGWYDQCNAMVKAKQYSTVDACLLNNSAAVDNSVNAYNTAIQQQNQKINQLSQNLPTTNFQGEKITSTDALTSQIVNDNFRTSLSNSVNGVFSGNNIKVAGHDVSVSDMIARINTNTITLPQAEALQLNAGLLNSNDPTVAFVAKGQVQSILGQVWSNSNINAQQVAFASQFGSTPVVISTQKLTQYPLTSTSVTTFGQVKNKYMGAVPIPDSTLITTVVDEASGGAQYLLTLTSAYVISQTYSIASDGTLTAFNGQDPKNPQDPNPLKISFKFADATTYQNRYLNAQVQYYETGQYAGLPAIVPFDLTNGWYAEVKSNLPNIPVVGTTGNINSYDASGRVSSFYLCNIGPNGLEENMGGDDICRGFVPGANQPPDFPGLSSSQSQALMTKAANAIADATKQHKTGVSQVTINGQPIKVGQPSASIPNIQCEDFMSPSDCNIMFNVCDPVVCPSSRCNLGGAYPVQDVIQSGVVGSLLLCSQNYPQVKVPICVSGVNAGLQGYISVLKSYQQCLQTSLDTGQTVGICDEVNSVYMCQFFWKQGIPIINYALPKITGNLLGNSKGGGEYLAGSDAINNAQKSVDYFSQYYAANSYKAFQERSTQSIGDSLCQNFISMNTPSGGNLFDALVTPDSPPQFYGQFDEIPYTTATNPPTSQYKVFYHIYAGTDFPAYFQVYLKGSGTSFYQDTSVSRSVDSGFIPAGSFKTNTLDFTAPSGYQQLCIVINGKEDCGFKQVTTDFGVNSIQQQYLSSQASQTNVTSEAACVSGTPSAYSLLNPNIQAGVSNAANPAIYNQGITRVCSTSNPGQGTDPNLGTANARWQPVGYCDTQNIKCWLDTNSVKNVIVNTNVQDATLQTVGSQYVQALNSQGAYLDNAGFSSLTSYLDSISGQNSQIISSISSNISKVTLNNQKAELYIRRGNAYTNLALQGYSSLIKPTIAAGANPNAAGKADGSFCAYDSECQSGYCDPFSAVCSSGLSKTPPDTSLTACISCLQLGKQWSLDSSGAGTCVNYGSSTSAISVSGSVGMSAADATTSCTTLRETFNSNNPTGTNTGSQTGTGNVISCTDANSCQIALGNRIIQLAQQIEQQKPNIDFSTVQRDTGAKNFECLALEVAMGESSIKQCKQTQVNNNPLYCNGDTSNIIGGDATGNVAGSLGVMQINSIAHPDANIADFNSNVNYGLTMLANGYNSDGLVYNCDKQADGVFRPITYSGWERALRNYNGWNSQCTKTDPNTNHVVDVGNPDYVSYIESQASKVVALFPQCATSA